MSSIAGKNYGTEQSVSKAPLKLKENDIYRAAREYLHLRKVDGKRFRGGDIDFAFTNRLTKLARGLDSDFEKVVILVSKTPQSKTREELGIEVQPDINRNGHMVIEFNSLKTANLMERVLLNESMTDFHDGIKMIIRHEIGHLKAAKLNLGRIVFRGGTMNLNLFEPIAQLYALGKSGDPINAMASASAICYEMEKADSMKGIVKDWLDHLYLGITVKKKKGEKTGLITSFIDLETKDFGYLRPEVEREIVTRAEMLLPQLRRNF